MSGTRWTLLGVEGRRLLRLRERGSFARRMMEERISELEAEVLNPSRFSICLFVLILQFKYMPWEWDSDCRDEHHKDD